MHFGRSSLWHVHFYEENLLISLSLCFPFRCNGAVRCGPCGEHPGKVSVRPGGVCKEPVPQPAKPLWTPPPTPALPAHCLIPSHRAAVFRASGRQDAHRDTASRHVALGFQLQLALHAHCATRPTHLPPLQREWAMRRNACLNTLIHPSLLLFILCIQFLSFPGGSTFPRHSVQKSVLTVQSVTVPVTQASQSFTVAIEETWWPLLQSPTLTVQSTF